MICTVRFIKKILHAKSPQLFFHSVATAELAAMIVMFSKEAELDLGVSVREAYLGGVIHDIGKLYVSEAILDKPGGLTNREWETVKLHPAWGRVIVEDTPLASLMAAVTQHHEGGTGVGYPYGLANHEIAPIAKVVSVADIMSALLEDRSYRRSVPDPALVFSIVKDEVEALLGMGAVTPVSKALAQYMAVGQKHRDKAERLSGRFVKRLLECACPDGDFTAMPHTSHVPVGHGFHKCGLKVVAGGRG